LLDIYLKGSLTGIDLAIILNEKNIPFVYLSANSNQSILEQAKLTQPYGFMIKPFREQEILIALEIARYRHENSLEAEQRKIALLKFELKKLKEVEKNINDGLLNAISVLQPYLPFDYLVLGRSEIVEHDQQWVSFLRVSFNEYQRVAIKELLVITGINDNDFNERRKHTPIIIKPIFFNGPDFVSETKSDSLQAILAHQFDLGSKLVFPVIIDQGAPFIFSFYSKSGTIYTNKHISFLKIIQEELSDLANIYANSNISGPKPGEKNLAKIKAGENIVNNLFPDTIGNSQPLLEVLDQVTRVAVVDSSVLILGETGTGKELIAYHIHRLSRRKDNPFIKVNCAALPLNLVESELFGHEKGAFTGAAGKRIGRFELAQNGTLFLDEIGDMPLDIQVKLLRVLQEKEIDRVGGEKSIKINVRIIAATNKNLEQEVAEGRFRLDLFYRLNIFPITLPPLKARKQDINLLVDFFINKYAKLYNMNVRSISKSALSDLMNHDWPGNIRELENQVERCVVSARTDCIESVYITKSKELIADAKAINSFKTIDEVEKEHILIVLEQCNHKVYGPSGAAALLNTPPSTLTSKMKRLGITSSYMAKKD
jgi:transcriptional regulator with GAF, ATPase, and Fis domain